MKQEYISELALRRLPSYIQYLSSLKGSKVEYTSASDISRHTGVHHTQVRKDLAMTGAQGLPKVGHKVESLIEDIRRFLNWDNTNDAFLIGVGNLGSALLRYPGFEKAGIKIVAAFDNDASKIGSRVNDVQIFALEKLPNLAARLNAKISIICTPADSAEEIVELLKHHKFKGIWNFTPTTLNPGDDIVVENVNIYPSLAVLCHKLNGGATK